MRDIRFLLKPRYSNSRALVIGINRYKTASPLSYAVSDAEEIRELLQSNLGFSEDGIAYLHDEEATKDRILKEFLRFSSDDANVDLDERIFVFFAGHGHTRTGIRGEVGYLVPYDADMQDPSTFIRWDELTRNAELIRAKHMLFIMDACYGGLAVTRNLQSGSTRFLKDMMLRYSRQVLTAGKANEVVADAGGPLPNHSVFTGHLIEGLKGGAASRDGVITANGLMAYVYNKVANDRNSNQTPHYGHIDGDGDFVFSSPSMFSQTDDGNKDVDELIVVPFVEEEHSRASIQTKVSRIKQFLSQDSSVIDLHDFMIDEVRHLLSESSEDHFKVQGQFSTEEFLERISNYERIASDLCILLAILTYWAKPQHRQTIQKILARSTDRLESQGGLVVWLHLRWYPMLLELYCSGIAAIEGQRFDSLADVFYTKVVSSERRSKEEFFVEAVMDEISELHDAFKKLPGHDRHYVPMSEYLFKLLQPQLDDVLFIGKNYERAFDEFEVFLALVVADIRHQNGMDNWGPIGRFGWKHRRGDSSPFSQIVNSARAAGENWPPLKAGLFGGDVTRFLTLADDFSSRLARLNWW